MNEQELIQQEAQLIDRIETLDVALKPFHEKAQLGKQSVDEVERWGMLLRDWLAAKRQLQAVESMLRFG